MAPVDLNTSNVKPYIQIVEMLVAHFRLRPKITDTVLDFCPPDSALHINRLFIFILLARTDINKSYYSPCINLCETANASIGSDETNCYWNISIINPSAQNKQKCFVSDHKE